MKHTRIIEVITNRFKSSEFLQNSLSLMSGTSVAHLIPLALSPVISRLYTPEDFDVLAIYMAIVTLLSPIVTGTYDQAVMLPKKDEDAFELAIASVALAFIISLLILPITIIWNRQLCLLFKNDQVGTWLYFIPLSMFLVSLFNILQAWFTRNKRFQDIASSLALQSVSINLINVGLGFAQTGSAGLVSGRIGGQFLSSVLLVWIGIKNHLFGFRLSLSRILDNLKTYRDFPRFTAPRVLMDGLRDSLIIFLIASFFVEGTLGSYSFMTKVLGVPLSLIGMAVAKVYYQKSADAHNRGKKIWFILKPVLIGLSLIALPIVIILLLFGPPIFSFIFGKEWTEAGKFTQLLAPWFLLRFIFISVAQTPLIVNRHKPFLFLMGGLNISVPAIFALTAVLTNNIQQSFLYLTIFGCIYLLIILGWFCYLVITENPTHSPADQSSV